MPRLRYGFRDLHAGRPAISGPLDPFEVVFINHHRHTLSCPSSEHRTTRPAHMYQYWLTGSHHFHRHFDGEFDR